MIRTTAAASTLLLLLTSLPAQAWTQLTPAPYPNTLARRAGALAYDLLNGRLMMYGGLQSGPTLTLDDTWGFDGATWTQITPTTTPPPRWGHRMVFDSRRFRVVTFGGRSPTTTANSNDTWEWDGQDWVQVFPAVSPSARAFYSMAFDERRGKTIIYGAQSGFPNGDQTWEYDGTTWAQVTTAFVPPGLETPAMVYDKGRAVTVMFGGFNGLSPGTMYDNTWEYNGVDWVQRAPANSPSPRYRAGCVYDDIRGRVVVYGGFGSGSALQDTWEYDGNDWVQALQGGPTKSTEAYVAYFPLTGQTVHFGGSGPGGTNNETWLYNGPTTAIAAAFGQGCPTSAGVPALSPLTVPQLGGSYSLGLTNGSFSGAGLMALGFSNTNSALGGLPADLSPVGFAGCQLEVSGDSTLFLVLAGGNANLSFAVPNNPAFTNLRLFAQALVLDGAAANGNGGLSNAVHAVFGN